MKEKCEREIESLWKRVSYLISKATQPQEIILGIAKEGVNLLHADAASVRLLEGENLTLVGGYGLSEEYKAKIPLKMGEGLVGKVAKLKKPLFSEDIEKDKRILYPEVGRKEGIASLVCVPVIAEDRLLGTFTVYSKNKRAWSEKEVEMLSLLAEQLALTLERIKDLETLREKSIKDELTGLYSRSYFLARTKEELARASREKGAVSFLFCDIDNFKAVNRTQGYKEGDKVLCKVAKLIKSSVRKEDVVCRYGGDEFVVLLPRTYP
ncbi:diguanylate cyclase, partial [Candidatus Aerophobetes bacterium]|nr:diguanylate cyclase [Candidatus Aerophobetes bacterium]